MGGDWCYDTAGAHHAKCEGLVSRGKCEWYAFSAEELGDVDYECSRLTSFIPGEEYDQKTYCGSVKSVLKECREECNSRDTCSVFFYQEHKNDRGCASSPHGGYQICGFYAGVDKRSAVKHSHHVESQICYNMKGTSKPRGKCLELEKKTESEVVIKNDEDCAAFCAKKHFGCLDYRKGANQMLSCAQACHMRVALDQSKDQCMSRCDRHGNSGCTLTVNG